MRMHKPATFHASTATHRKPTMSLKHQLQCLCVCMCLSLHSDLWVPPYSCIVSRLSHFDNLVVVNAPLCLFYCIESICMCACVWACLCKPSTKASVCHAGVKVWRKWNKLPPNAQACVWPCVPVKVGVCEILYTLAHYLILNISHYHITYDFSHTVLLFVCGCSLHF